MKILSQISPSKPLWPFCFSALVAFSAHATLAQAKTFEESPSPASAPFLPVLTTTAECEQPIVVLRSEEHYAFALAQMGSQTFELVLTTDGRCYRNLCPASIYETVPSSIHSLGQPTLEVTDDTIGKQQSSITVTLSGRQFTCRLVQASPSSLPAIFQMNAGSIGH